MVSPRGGRGRGTRTSPQKGFSQASQQPNRNVVDRAMWTPSLTRCLLEACAEESDEYGRALTGFSSLGWQRIVNAFARKTGTMMYKKEQLKNKHDRLKDERKAWILVAEDTSQTGLGRDPDTVAITGPEPWWAAMLADCIGAMDGTHVFCKPKPKDVKNFWGHKGGHTTNIIVVCDFNLCFTFTSLGWEEAMYDYLIFEECVLGKGKNKFPHPPEGKYYLVDGGYPNAKGYMAPYKGHMYHLEDLRPKVRQQLGDNEYFNRWHLSLRSVIERTFGVWKNRWRMMKISTYYPLALHKRYVLASMGIHNFIIHNCPDDEEFQEALRSDENYDNNDIPDIDPRNAEMEAAEDILFLLHANDSNMRKVRDEIMTNIKLDRQRAGRS